jgi:hypothetical protein
VFYLYQDGGFNTGSAKMPPLSSAPTVGRRGLASYQLQMLIANRESEGSLLGSLKGKVLLWGGQRDSVFFLFCGSSGQVKRETPK